MANEFPAKRASNMEIISIWWRHHIAGAFGFQYNCLACKSCQQCSRWWLWNPTPWLINWSNASKSSWTGGILAKDQYFSVSSTCQRFSWQYLVTTWWINHLNMVMKEKLWAMVEKSAVNYLEIELHGLTDITTELTTFYTYFCAISSVMRKIMYIFISMSC